MRIYVLCQLFFLIEKSSVYAALKGGIFNGQ